MEIIFDPVEVSVLRVALKIAAREYELRLERMTVEAASEVANFAREERASVLAMLEKLQTVDTLYA